MLTEYTHILIFILISIFIATILAFLPFYINKSKAYTAKNSPYECGFNPITKIETNFNIKFYLISILFIIFDIEIALLLPWALIIKKISWLGFFGGISFVTLLIIGFIYEWKKGALDL